MRVVRLARTTLGSAMLLVLPLLASLLSPTASAAATGAVTAWGSNSNGQTVVPPGVTNAVAVAAGDSHSLAILADGTVAAWGGNSAALTNVPAGLSNVVQVAGGGMHSLALRAVDHPDRHLEDVVGRAAAGSYDMR